MDRNDQRAIGQLFEKLANIERQAPPRDAEAERFIQDQITQQPGAPYYMAQTIVVQEEVLNAAQARIEELEEQAQQPAGGGPLSGLFGRSGGRRSGSVPRVGRTASVATEGPQDTPQRAGGGFLAGAALTAIGAACCSATRSPAYLAAAKRRQPRPQHRSQTRRVPTSPAITASTAVETSATLNCDNDTGNCDNTGCLQTALRLTVIDAGG